MKTLFSKLSMFALVLSSTAAMASEPLKFAVGDDVYDLLEQASGTVVGLEGDKVLVTTDVFPDYGKTPYLLNKTDLMQRVKPLNGSLACDDIRGFCEGDKLAEAFVLGRRYIIEKIYTNGKTAPLVRSRKALVYDVDSYEDLFINLLNKGLRKAQ